MKVLSIQPRQNIYNQTVQITPSKTEQKMLYSQTNKYKVYQKIGTGAQAEVFLAYDSNRNQYCAIKVLRGDFLNDEKTLRRFKREIGIMTRLQEHPNIAQVYDFSFNDNSSSENPPFIAMELLTEKTLHDLINLYWSPLNEGNLNPVERKILFNDMLLIISSIFRALDLVHKYGIMHRDVKPKNILLSPMSDPREPPQAKLADFGISLDYDASRFTSLDAFVGTPAYVAPEQISTQNPDGRIDFYSLGAILYEITEGKPPFQATDFYKLLQDHINVDPEPPNNANKIDPMLVEIILKLLKKNPFDRYQQGIDVSMLLESIVFKERKLKELILIK